MDKLLIVLLIGVLAWTVIYHPSYRVGETLERVQVIFAEAEAREQARRQAYVDAYCPALGSNGEVITCVSKSSG